MCMMCDEAFNGICSPLHDVVLFLALHTQLCKKAQGEFNGENDNTQILHMIIKKATMGSDSTASTQSEGDNRARRKSLLRSQQRLSYIDYNTHEYHESEESFFMRLPLNIEEHASITQKEVLRHLSEAIFCKRTLMSIILFVCITAIIMHVEQIQNSVIIESLSASKTAVSFFSIFLGFSLVFRTHVCCKFIIVLIRMHITFSRKSCSCLSPLYIR